MKLFTRTDASTTKQTIKLFLEQAKQDKKQVVLFSILIPLGHFLYIVLLPFLISLITQSIIENPHDLTTPSWLIGGMIVTSIITVVVNHFGFITLFTHDERVTTRLTQLALDGLLKHSHSFFANQKVGSLSGDVNTFARSYMGITDNIFLQLSAILVNFVASLIIIGFIAPILLIPLSLLTGFVIIHSIQSIQSRAEYRNKRKDMTSKLFGSIADLLANHTLVRLFGKQHTEIRRIIGERRAIELVAKKEFAIISDNSQVRQGVLFTFQIITLMLCVYLFGNASLSIGALIFTITYLGRITGTMYNISGIIRTTEQAFLDAAKITDILSINPEVQDQKNAKSLVLQSGSIAFDSVSFSYAEDKNQTVFNDLNLVIPSGQRVGLVGRSGGGKTTLTSLLLRYMDITTGTITIDKQDISHVAQLSLRDAISYVPQDPFLFHRSLRENIAYGTTNASDKQIRKAVKSANALEFIDTLPQGLDTIVGERGVKLSGGQRQRIAIARAILKDAPILVLDEATSALDSESEKLIQESLEKLMKDRTSIVIAHRLSTIAKLDRIIVLDHGQIVEDGTHAELLRKNGIYASLWNHQSGGFIEE